MIESLPTPPYQVGPAGDRCRRAGGWRGFHRADGGSPSWDGQMAATRGCRWWAGWWGQTGDGHVGMEVGGGDPDLIVDPMPDRDQDGQGPRSNLKTLVGMAATRLRAAGLRQRLRAGLSRALSRAPGTSHPMAAGRVRLPDGWRACLADQGPARLATGPRVKSGRRLRDLEPVLRRAPLSESAGAYSCARGSRCRPCRVGSRG